MAKSKLTIPATPNTDAIMKRLAAIAAEQAELEAQLLAEEQKRLDEVYEKAVTLLKDASVTLAGLADYIRGTGTNKELLAGFKTSEPTKATGTRKARKPLTAKYFNPKNPAETWTGVGKYEPEWIKPYRESKDGVKPKVYKAAVHIANKPA